MIAHHLDKTRVVVHSGPAELRVRDNGRHVVDLAAGGVERAARSDVIVGHIVLGLVAVAGCEAPPAIQDGRPTHVVLVDLQRHLLGGQL